MIASLIIMMFAVGSSHAYRYPDSGPSPPTVAATPTPAPTPGLVLIPFGISDVTACKGTDVEVIWKGYHNLDEMASSDCGSGKIGSQIVDWHNSGYTQIFSGTENLLQAKNGETRYFRCDEHCNNARFSVSCPASPGQATDAPTPASGASKRSVIPFILAGAVVKLSVLLFMF